MLDDSVKSWYQTKGFCWIGNQKIVISGDLNKSKDRNCPRLQCQVTEYLNGINFRGYLPEWTRLLSLVKPAIQVPREKQVKRKKGETGSTETWGIRHLLARRCERIGCLQAPSPTLSSSVVPAYPQETCSRRQRANKCMHAHTRTHKHHSGLYFQCCSSYKVKNVTVFYCLLRQLDQL